MTESKLSRLFKEDKKLPFLYFITNRKLCYPKPLEEVIHKALDAGIRFVQLREKDLNSLDLYILAKKVKNLTDQYGAYLLINDRVDIALSIEAEGVHLTETSLPTEKVRRLLGNNKIIGKSIHLPIAISKKGFTDIDFVTLSPVFNNPGKEYKTKIIGIDRLKKAVSITPVPVYALGGITPDNVKKVRNAKVYGIAVSSGILKASDIKKSVEEYLI